MSWGVEDTGFLKKTISDILTEIETEQKDTISPSLNVLATALLGQINGIFGDKLRELWDVAEAVYRSQYPDTASQDALDQLAALTGATRLRPQKSPVTLDQMFLDGATTVPAGSIVSVGALGARFATLAALTNAAAFPQTLSVAAESEEYGPIPGYAETINNIVTPIVGWNAKAAITCANAETYLLDGLVLALEIDETGPAYPTSFSGGNPWSAAAVAALISSSVPVASAVDAGGYVRIASDLDGPGSSIRVQAGPATTVLGFSTTKVEGFNTADAALGRNVETDADFRLRREELLRITGAATVEAIRARILGLAYMLQTFVFENVTMATVNGLPPTSFESVAQGGLVSDEQEIAETIWDVKPAGIQAFGSIIKSVVDSQGFSHNIGFSRPTDTPIYVEAELTAFSATFPADGIDQVKAAIKAYGDLQQIGEDVIALQYKAIPLTVSGVEDVTVFKIDDIFPPVGTTNISIPTKSLASFDLADIDVSVTTWL
jgi:uncharacterized phage protein gp47/JayE